MAIDDDLAEQLAHTPYAYLIAPAGCGKTELIAKAVALKPDNRQLVLTHTHAGVHSLRNRMRQKGITINRARVDTIAGLALRWSAAYPRISGLKTTTPTGEEWTTVYKACLRTLNNPNVQDILRASYVGIYVDEYQDCTISQHELIMRLAMILSCRILGDPMQGIFGFGKEPLFKLEQMPPKFERLPDAVTPWRWQQSNPNLGEWLRDARNKLANGSTIDVRGGPIRWVRLTGNNQSKIQERLKICFDVFNKQPGTIVAIHEHANLCHAVARRLSGTYVSMEEFEARELRRFAEELQKAQGIERVIVLIDFVKKCRTKASQELSSIIGRFSKGQLPDLRRLKKNVVIAKALIEVAEHDDLDSVLLAIECMESLPGALFRRELWTEMKRSLAVFKSGEYDSLVEAAWYIRQQTSRVGRRLDRAIVSRTLLVKGLEFNHSILLHADRLDAKNLYVAMTRGSNTLTVISDSPILPST